jgi:hypothetical protein
LIDTHFSDQYRAVKTPFAAGILSPHLHVNNAGTPTFSIATAALERTTWRVPSRRPSASGEYNNHNASFGILTARRYDFTTTFDVIVGSAKGREKRFPVYHDLLTARSDFLMDARAAQTQQPVRLDDEDPEVFSLYLNCVHSGIEVVRAGDELLGKQFHPMADGAGGLVKKEYGSEPSAEKSEDDHDGGRFEALIKLHLIASRLQDFGMMNSAVDELVRMIDEASLIPMQVNLVYSSAKRGDPLRALIRDVYLHEAESSENHEFLQTSELHSDFWRDIFLEYFKLKETNKVRRRGVRLENWKRQRSEQVRLPPEKD